MRYLRGANGFNLAHLSQLIFRKSSLHVFFVPII